MKKVARWKNIQGCPACARAAPWGSPTNVRFTWTGRSSLQKYFPICRIVSEKIEKIENLYGGPHMQERHNITSTKDRLRAITQVHPCAKCGGIWASRLGGV